jgi:hypothetical protein
MPRKPRFFVPDLAAQFIQRDNNRQAIFFEAADYERYLSLVRKKGSDPKSGYGKVRLSLNLHSGRYLWHHNLEHQQNNFSRPMQRVPG